MEDYSLFELEKDYHLGNYQSCINKANSMPASRESTFYMCLSYYHLRKYDILNHEVAKSSEKCAELIKLLVAYTDNVGQRESIIRQLDSMLNEGSIDSKDDLSRLVISSIYAREKMYSNALRSLHQLDTLPAMLAQVGIYLLMNRVDLAERQLKLMQSKDDYATLTLLAVAQVRLAAGNSKEAHDVAKELEDKYKATPLLNNIRTAAAISMGQHDIAKQHCQNSLDLDNDNLEALINMIYLLSKLRASKDVKERYFGRLKAQYPEHEFVKEVESLELKFI